MLDSRWAIAFLIQAEQLLASSIEKSPENPDRAKWERDLLEIQRLRASMQPPGGG